MSKKVRLTIQETIMVHDYLRGKLKKLPDGYWEYPKGQNDASIAAEIKEKLGFEVIAKNVTSVRGKLFGRLKPQSPFVKGHQINNRARLLGRINALSDQIAEMQDITIELNTRLETLERSYGTRFGFDTAEHPIMTERRVNGGGVRRV